MGKLGVLFSGFFQTLRAEAIVEFRPDFCGGCQRQFRAPTAVELRSTAEFGTAGFADFAHRFCFGSI